MFPNKYKPQVYIEIREPSQCKPFQVIVKKNIIINQCPKQSNSNHFDIKLLETK